MLGIMKLTMAAIVVVFVIILICIQFSCVESLQFRNALSQSQSKASHSHSSNADIVQRYKRSPNAENILEEDYGSYPISEVEASSEPFVNLTDSDLSLNISHVIPKERGVRPRMMSTDIERTELLQAALIPPEIGELYTPKNYNKLEIPKAKSEDGESLEPVPVQVFLSIRSVFEVDETNEEIALEMDFIVEWLDGIIYETTKAKMKSEGVEIDFDFDEFEQKPLDPVFLNKIWKPDIYIERLVETIQPLVITRPVRFRFSSQGRISYSTRMIVKVDCILNFQYYPADTQKCHVILRSYSYNNSDLRLMWRFPDGVYLMDRSDDNFDVAVGSLRRYNLMTRLYEDKGKNDTFDTLQFTVFARRKLSYQLIQTYIPSTLYITITWLCFMIPIRMIEARMAIAMTTLLTLTSMFGAVRDSTPVVSYIKAIDIWMVSNISFVFLTLLEFAIVLWTESAKNDEQERDKKEKEETEEKLVENNSNNDLNINIRIRTPNKPTVGTILRKRLLARFIIIVEFVEVYAFIIIASSFTFWNLCYWSWLLVMSGYFDWDVDPKYNAMGKVDKEESIAEKILDDLPLYYN